MSTEEACVTNVMLSLSKIMKILHDSPHLENYASGVLAGILRDLQEMTRENSETPCIVDKMPAKKRMEQICKRYNRKGIKVTDLRIMVEALKQQKEVFAVIKSPIVLRTLYEQLDDDENSEMADLFFQAVEKFCENM